MEQKPTADSDLGSALDLIIGDTPADKSRSVLLPEKQRKEQERTRARPTRTTTGATRQRVEPVGDDRPKARTGRPPGVRSGRERPKDKTSLALDLELMDRYRKQSWKEECQLGELVERALRQYAQETWKWRFEK